VCKRLGLVLLLSCWWANPVLASDKADVLARIQSTVDAWTRGEPLANPPQTIIDNLPPYRFRGPTAATDWGKAYADSTNSKKVTNVSLKLLSPKTVEVSGMHAYAVVPGEWSFNENGKGVVEHGVITVVLDKIDQNWQIAVWIWTPR
jgi:hypothetical protein